MKDYGGIEPVKAKIKEFENCTHEYGINWIVKKIGHRHPAAVKFAKETRTKYYFFDRISLMKERDMNDGFLDKFLKCMTG